MSQLLTDQQVVREFGLPSTRTLRTMRAQGLPFLSFTKPYLYEREDVERFIQNSKVVTCQERTEAPTLSGSQSGTASISSGTKTALSDSAAAARMTAQLLKRSSARSLSSDRVRSNQPGRVIPVNFQSPTR